MYLRYCAPEVYKESSTAIFEMAQDSTWQNPHTPLHFPVSIIFCNVLFQVVLNYWKLVSPLYTQASALGLERVQGLWLKASKP